MACVGVGWTKGAVTEVGTIEGGGTEAGVAGRGVSTLSSNRYEMRYLKWMSVERSIHFDLFDIQMTVPLALPLTSRYLRLARRRVITRYSSLCIRDRCIRETCNQCASTTNNVRLSNLPPLFRSKVYTSNRSIRYNQIHSEKWRYLSSVEIQLIPSMPCVLQSDLIYETHTSPRRTP